MLEINSTFQRNPKSDTRDLTTNPILSGMKTFHNRSFCFSKFYFNTILQATPKPSMRSISFTFSKNVIVCTFLIYARSVSMCVYYIPDCIALIMFGINCEHETSYS